MSEQMSQVQAINGPRPKTWDEYENGCLATFGGGYRTTADIDIFQHGMSTVFNLLRREFPAAEQCKAAPDLLAACEKVKDRFEGCPEGWSDELWDEFDAALSKAKATQ